MWKQSIYEYYLVPSEITIIRHIRCQHASFEVHQISTYIGDGLQPWRVYIVLYVFVFVFIWCVHTVVKHHALEQLIRSTCEQCILTTLFPRSLISIIVQEEHDDGSVSYPVRYVRLGQ